jgi:hypothetical protein
LFLAKCINVIGCPMDMVSVLACNVCDVSDVTFITCNKCNVAYITCDKCDVCDVCNKCEKILCGMTVQLSEYFSFEKGGTESLPEVFLHDNCDKIYFILLPSHKKRNEKRDSFYTAKRVSL